MEKFKIPGKPNAGEIAKWRKTHKDEINQANENAARIVENPDGTMSIGQTPEERKQYREGYNDRAGI